MLYLNTDFAGPQLRDVCEREGISLLVHDEEYDGAGRGRSSRATGALLAWTDDDRRATTRSRR